MNSPDHARLIAFLHGALDPDEHARVLEAIEASPPMAAEVRAAAAGLEAIRAWAADEPADARTTSSGGRRKTSGGRRTVPRGSGLPGRRAAKGDARIPGWWIPLTVAATLALAVPATLLLDGARNQGEPIPSGVSVGSGTAASSRAGIPTAGAPSFVLVLHGTWPDESSVTPDETLRRAEEYWAWTSDLAERGILVAAGDLRWEPGRRIDARPTSTASTPVAIDDPDFLVGMIAVRVDSYAAALSLARECPHLRYGGAVSVRQVGSGFVTVPGMDDWSD